MHCLLHTKDTSFQTTLFNLNFSEGVGVVIDFLNKVRGKLGNVFIDFSKRIIFWDIPKWNR